MANSTVYPYGTDGELPASIGIINDLTTGGSDKALSAEQGKVIGQELSKARYTRIETEKIRGASFSLGASKKWIGTYNAQKHMVVQCKPGDKFSIEPVGSGNFYGWLTSSYSPPTSANTSTPYCSGCDRVWLTIQDSPLILTAPSDAAYLCLVLADGANPPDTSTWNVYKMEDIHTAFDDSITKEELQRSIEYKDPSTIVYEKVGHFSFVADGDTYKSASLGELIPGDTYKLVMDDFMWEDPSIITSSSGYKFNIFYVGNSDTSSTQVVYYYRQYPVPNEFVFEAEADVKRYGFGGRGISGTTVGATLYRQVNRPRTGEVTDDIIRLVRQALFNSTEGVLGLLHYSDIHGDTIASNHIQTAIGDLEGYLDDVIATGDSVYYYSSDLPWWTGCGLPEKSLFVVGNHDGRVGANLDGEGKPWTFQNFFEPYIEGLGYDMPDGYDDSTSANYKACYWSKDYPGAKVRLIGVDGIHRCDGVVNPETGAIVETGKWWNTNEQELWLIDKLNETLDSENDAYGYSVVVAGHFCLDPFSGDNNITNTSETGGRVIDYKTTAQTNFHYSQNTGYSIDGNRFNYRSYTSSGSVKDNNNFAEILTSWQQRGGKFIAWICGHMHFDLFYYPTNYPNLLCVSVNQAGWRRTSAFENRSTTLDGRMCANYYAIDPASGLFKIIRIGKHDNRYLGSIRYLCYDYINKKVINEG